MFEKYGVCVVHVRHVRHVQLVVNLYSRTDTDEKWINNNYNFGINDCRECNLWQRNFGRVLEPLL